MPACDCRGGTLKPVSLKTPLGEEVLDLVAGDMVELSGIVFTARDEAHLRMMEEGIPFDPEGAAIFHCGPVVVDERIVAAGPTTSARMNDLSGFLLDAGVRALVGKGGMGAGVVGQLKERGVYLALTGGCAALAASRMTLRGVYFDDLGMAEATWIIEFDRVPLVVGIDSHGRDLYEEVDTHAKEQFKRRFTL
ncbi:MAG: fumarate hydratase [Methanolinea sp. SDB]|nr:MAG: fumarate hydratase [Methanolinea sp. SDB]